VVAVAVQWYGRELCRLLGDSGAVTIPDVGALIAGLDTTLGILRVIFLVSAILAALVCVVDWAVRTRRISPFSGVARFFRGSVDPLLAPVERRVIRSGGVPSSAPWWALAAVVVIGIVALAALGFLRNQIVWLAAAASGGPRDVVRLLVTWAFGILQIALVVRVISSWFNVSPYSKWIRWSVVLTEPILRPLRRVIPSFGPIDVTPIAAYFLIWLVSAFVLGLL
jgi:YggT family protein